MYPYYYWTDKYDHQSKAEGWIITNDPDGHLVIAKLDDPGACDGVSFNDPVFEFDKDAQQYVATRALEGSYMHLLAIWLHGQRMRDKVYIPPPTAIERKPN